MKVSENQSGYLIGLGFGDKKIKNPTKIYTKFSKELNKFDIILIDTAGRDALSKDLIKELKSINKTVKPSRKTYMM